MFSIVVQNRVQNRVQYRVQCGVQNPGNTHAKPGEVYTPHTPQCFRTRSKARAAHYSQSILALVKAKRIGACAVIDPSAVARIAASRSPALHDGRTFYFPHSPDPAAFPSRGRALPLRLLFAVVEQSPGAFASRLQGTLSLQPVGSIGPTDCPSVRRTSIAALGTSHSHAWPSAAPCLRLSRSPTVGDHHEPH